MQRYGLQLFQKHIKQYEPVDPMYETYVDNRGRTKRRRREIPPGLSARDAKILKKVQRRAHYLDKGMSLCGFRVGWTFWIGLVPGAGDIADAALNYFLVVRKAQQAEIPKWLFERMLLNNAISAGIGFVPILGDFALATFKANSRNAALLEEFLRVRGVQFIQEHGQADVRAGAGVVPGEQVPGKGHGFWSSLRGNKTAPTTAVAAPHATTTGPGHGAGVHQQQVPIAPAAAARGNAPALPARR